MSQPIRVIVVDDSALMRRVITGLIEQDPAIRVVATARNGREAIELVQELRPDIVTMDVRMPVMDGLATTEHLMAYCPTPILVLTARAATQDRIDGLDAGADDYLVKPFDLGELLARVRALLRRGVGDVTRFADLVLDPAARQGTRGTRLIQFSETEFALLDLFVRHPGQVLTREVIADRVWGYDFGPASNPVEVYVRYLRRKLGEPRLIHTVRGVGYQLRTP